ncbi:MAG: hypothetical protein E6R03_17385 [Hyphomicrobiaceae bacterium]|nr:MAG: hypothetical protein E6R03_17385 [Hyphomicrobiaceae bacterium]
MGRMQFFRATGGFRPRVAYRRYYLAKRVLAAKISPEREQVIRNKYTGKLPVGILDDVIGNFFELGEYLEWGINELLKYYDKMQADHPTHMERDYTYSLKRAVKELANHVQWFDEAKTVRDPRVEQHPAFNQQKKWDIRGYDRSNLGDMSNRYPRTYKPKDLFIKYTNPVKVVAEESRKDGDWTMIMLDADSVRNSIKEEMAKARELVQEYQRSVVIPMRGSPQAPQLDFSIKTAHDFSFFITSSMVGTKESPGPLFNTFFEQIWNPLTSSGYSLKVFANNKSSVYVYPPSLTGYMKALCGYANAAEVDNDADSWCTSDPRMASSYLSQGPFYLIFRDGRPVIQYHPDSQQLQTTDRRELHNDASETGNLTESQANFVREWLKEYANYGGGDVELDWDELQNAVDLPSAEYDSSELEYWLDEFQWIFDFDQNPTENDLIRARNGLDWAAEGGEPEWTSPFDAFLHLEAGKKPQGYRSPQTGDLFDDDPQNPTYRKLTEEQTDAVYEWIETKRFTDTVYKDWGYGQDIHDHLMRPDAEEAFIKDIYAWGVEAAEQLEEAQRRLRDGAEIYQTISEYNDRIQRAFRREDVEDVRSALGDASSSDAGHFYEDVERQFERALSRQGYED